jgi:hypothetical protein
MFAFAFAAMWNFSDPARVQAQVLYGTMVGNIKDSSAAAVPGASVTVTNRLTNQSREAITNDTGDYTLTNLQPGTYTVKVSLPGFKEFTQTDVQVANNVITRVDATLEVGTLSETITVAAQATPLQTDKTDVNKEISTKEITDLPLNEYGNYQSLLDLVPGTTPSDFQNAVTDTPARALTTNVNGTARNSNNTRLDGATTVLTWLPHHTSYVAPRESIQTVNISTNNFDAEQGLAGGAAITVQTKSGSNRFRAVLFEHHTNSALRAKNFFIPAGTDVPKNIRNMYGGTFGGPIKKDKVFFFTSWEAMRERQNFSSLITVPTAQHRTGDFSDVAPRLFDPLTGDVNGRNRTEFAGSIIPASRISPIASKALSMVPLPNLSGNSSNYYASAPGGFDRDNYDFKVDWVRSKRNTIWTKYSRMNALVRCPPRLKEAVGAGIGNCSGSGKGVTRVQLATLGTSFVLSPKFLIDGIIGFSRYFHQTRGPDIGTNYGSDVLGIPGTNGPDPRQSGFPILTISSYETMGNPDTWSPVDRKDNSWTYSTNASWSKGKHDVRFGVDVARQHMNHWQPESGGRSPRGNLRFDGRATALNGGPATNRYNSLAQFLLGFTNEMGKALQFYDPMTTREWLIGLYFRDRFQVNRKLTLTLGLRWEYFPLMTRERTGIERYDLDENKVYLGRLGGVEDNVGVTVSKLGFSPRVGFAYRLTNKSVLRSGYGITVDPYPSARPLRSPYPVVIWSDHFADSFGYIGTLAKGIPEIVPPDITKGIIDIPSDVGTRTIEKGEFKRGYIQSWNMIYEHQLPFKLVGAVGYVATRSIRQFASIELNTAPPGGGNAGREYFKKFGRSATTSLHAPWQTSTYDSMQATVDRRFSGGLFIKSSYTWSKAIGYNANSGEGCCTFTHPSVMHRQRAIQDFDRTHNWRNAWLWDLPFGAGKRWAQSGFAKAMLGGWQLNGIFSAYSGRPFTVSSSGTSLQAPGSSQVADQVLPEVKKLGTVGRNVPFFDPLAFRAVTETRFGNVGRNSLRGPGYGSLDLSLFRKFKLTERAEMQFRAESTNFTNTPHFNNPGGSASDMRFDAATGALISSGGFFAVTGARSDERQFRFGLRLSF